MNVMTMEVTPQRRNKHEINTQIKEKQSQPATETQNRKPTAAGGSRTYFVRPLLFGFVFFLIWVFISCLFRLFGVTSIVITFINSSLNNQYLLKLSNMS